MTKFFSNNIETLVKDEKFIELYKSSNFWAAAGTYYGFPSCCVENFCNSFAAQIYEKHPNHPMNGTGYVPCETCVEPSKNYSFFSELINQNRFSSAKFPDDSNEKELDMFYAQIVLRLEKNPIDVLKRHAHLSYMINDIADLEPIYLHVGRHAINISAIEQKDPGILMELIGEDEFVQDQFAAILEHHFKDSTLTNKTIQKHIDDIYDFISKGQFIISKENKIQKSRSVKVKM